MQHPKTSNYAATESERDLLPRATGGVGKPNRRAIMKATLIPMLAAAGLLFVSANEASAGWQRHGTLHTWRGTYTGSSWGGCGSGTCSRGGSITGPWGHTVWGTRSVSHSGPGQWSSSSSVTGPYGGTATRNGSVNCTGGSCTRNVTVTGPNGGSSSWTSTVP